LKDSFPINTLSAATGRFVPKPAMRIGLLGGTFDPIHQGHLALAEAALKQLKLDRFYFIPTYQHPLEKKDAQASASDRLEMIKLAIQNQPKLAVSNFEVKREGVSYTVDTIKEFRKQFPKPNGLFFITGGDWGKNLDQWKEIDTIFSLAHFVVASRPGFDLNNLPQSVEVLDFVPLNVSSTQLRRDIKEGKIPERFLSSDVIAYIKKQQLYRA